MRTGIPGINSMILKYQRRMAVYLSSQRTSLLFCHIHNTAALVVQAQNRGHAIPAGAALKGRGGFLFVPNTSR